MQLFVVPGNGQALLGMPYIDTLNIIKINIHSIDAEDVRNSKQYANMHTSLRSNPRQETDGDEKCCTNTDSILKSENSNTRPMVEAKASKLIDCFLAGPTYDRN